MVAARTMFAVVDIVKALIRTFSKSFVFNKVTRFNYLFLLIRYVIDYFFHFHLTIILNSFNLDL